MGATCVVLAAILLAVGIAQRQNSIESDPMVKIARQSLVGGVGGMGAREQFEVFRQQAEFEVRSYLTNEVVGFRRITRLTVLNFDAEITNWTASAQVEFFNQIGGVESKAVNLRFGSYARTLAVAFVDR
jgi:hypothetical protein